MEGTLNLSIRWTPQSIHIVDQPKIQSRLSDVAITLSFERNEMED